MERKRRKRERGKRGGGDIGEKGGGETFEESFRATEGVVFFFSRECDGWGGEGGGRVRREGGGGKVGVPEVIVCFLDVLGFFYVGKEGAGREERGGGGRGRRKWGRSLSGALVLLFLMLALLSILLFLFLFFHLFLHNRRKGFCQDFH